MNAGKVFETDWKNSMIKDGLWNKRINDTPMSYTKIASKYTPKNPYDFLCFKFPFLYCLELKETQQPLMSIQVSEDEPDNKHIKYHQIKGLADASKFEGVYAGFVMNFSFNGMMKVYYLSIENFLEFLQIEQKKSINYSDVEKYHGIPLDFQKLRTHYKYNITELLMQISEGSEISYGT